MKQIPVGKNQFALVDDCDFERLSKFKWVANASGYANRSVTRGKKSTTSFMAREILACPDGFVIDHKNRNPLDNRRENLRIATPQQNCFNKSRCKSNKSGFKGVFPGERRNTWHAEIAIRGKRVYSEKFTSRFEAAAAYNVAAEKFFGEFACLNDVPENYGDLPPEDNYAGIWDNVPHHTPRVPGQIVYSKLTPEQAIEIYQSADKVPAIAARFNIDPRNVRYIKAGITWKYVTGAASA